MTASTSAEHHIDPTAPPRANGAGTPRIAVIADGPSLVRRVQAGAGNAAAVVHLTDLAQLLDHSEAGEHYDVVVAGPPCGTRRGLGALAAYHEHAPRTSIVLAFDRPHVHTRDIVWVGADALIEPDSTEAIGIAVRRSLDLAAARIDEMAAVLERRQSPLGRTFTVCSATGGCGKTFYATNTAYFIARWTGARVALLDLDLQFGEVTTALRLKVRHTIADALSTEVDAEDGLAAHLDELVTRHDSGVDVLAAPRRPDEADQITPAEIGHVIEQLQAAYDYVVVDTPTGLGEGVLAAMDRSEHLFLLATLDLPSVRNLRLFVETLERLGVEDEHVSMILNKAQKGTGIDADEIQRVFPRPFRSVLPFSAAVPRSVNQGQPVLATAPQDEVSRLVGRSLVDFLPDDERTAYEAALVDTGRTSLLARVRRGLRSRPATTADASVAETPAGATPASATAAATAATATPATAIPAAATRGADA